MLEEAVEVMRELWTGELVTHRGDTSRGGRPQLLRAGRAPPDPRLGLREKSTSLAARIGDGYVNVDARCGPVASSYRERGNGAAIAAQRCAGASDEAKRSVPRSRAVAGRRRPR